MSLILLALQAATATAPPPTGYDDFDLARLPETQAGCGTEGHTGDVVVCGHKAMDFVFANPRDYAEKPVRAAAALPGGGSIAGHVVERELPGARAPAAMVTLRLPF